MTPAYFAQVHSTYIENWSDALYSLSISQIDIPLSLLDTIDFGTNITLLRNHSKKDWKSIFFANYNAVN
jgi:hypothetical protein